MKPNYLVGLVLALALPGCASTSGAATMQGCERSNARPANPHGSVLLPVREAPPATLLDDGVIRRDQSSADDGSGGNVNGGRNGQRR